MEQSIKEPRVAKMTEPFETADETTDNPVVSDCRLRPARMSDIDAIHALIEESSRTTTVLPRGRESLSEHLRDFMLMESEASLVGCGALNVINRNLAEIKSLVVIPSMQSQGLGGRLVQALLTEGRRLGLRRVFALTDSVAFFRSQGFSLADKETLPHKVWNECIRCPKFFNCQEEAVDLILNTHGANDETGNLSTFKLHGK